MKFSLAILAASISVAAAYPTLQRRQAGACPLNQLGGLSITAQAEESGTTRWDLFTESDGAITQGQLAWFQNDQLNGNEVFTANAGPAAGLFTFQRRAAQPIGVSNNVLQASTTATTFNVTCEKCDGLATGNDQAASGCTFEQIIADADGITPLLQCMTFTGSPAVVITTPCQAGNANQKFDIFTSE